MSDHQIIKTNTLSKKLEKEYTIVDDKYKIINRIAKGTTCKVKLALNLQDGKFYAMKMVSQNNRNISLAISMLEKEIEFHSRVKNENVIRLIEHNIQGKKLSKYQDMKKCQYITLEHALRGDMFDYISLSKGFTAKIARYYFKQLIFGLEALHGANICHRDIKIDNLLLSDDFKLKIADFEFCNYIRDSNDEHIGHTDKLGTISYMASEFFQLRKKGKEWRIYHFGDKVDIYASGVVLFIMLTGAFPFNSAERTDQDYKSFSEEKTRELFWSRKHTTNIPDSAKDLLAKLLDHPDRRIGLKEIKEHPFLNEEVPSDIEVFNYMSNVSAMIEMSRKGKM
jgi:serine/threonine protein kinase